MAAMPRVGAAVCMRDAASEGVVARVDASTVRVECAWGSAEFPAPSPAPAVGGAVALPGPCAGVVVHIEGDAVVVRAAWGSWRAAWARVGARGFGPPGTCVAWRAPDGARRTGVLLGWRAADGAHLVAPGLDVVPSGDVLRALPCADGYAVVTPFGRGAAAAVGDAATRAVLDWGGRLVAPHDARSVACPAATAAPVAHCVSGAAVAMVETAIGALKRLTDSLPASVRDALLAEDLDDRIDAGLSEATGLLERDAPALDRLVARTKGATRDLRSSLATALEADDVEAELAALARRKSGEAADIYEATARDVGDEAAELELYRTAAASDLGTSGDLRALVDGASSELASSLERAEADHPELRRARDEVTDLSGAVGAAVAESRAAKDLEAEVGRARAALEAESRTGALAKLMGAEVGADHRGDALRAKAREVAARVVASKLLDGAAFERAFDDALAAARASSGSLVAESAGGAGEAAAAVAHAAADFARAWLREARSAGFSRLPPDAAAAALEAALAAAVEAAEACGLGESWLLDLAVAADAYEGALARAATASVDDLVASLAEGAPESGDDLARRAAALALGYAGDGEHNALGALLAESPLKSALEDVAGSGDVAAASRRALDGDAAVDGVRRVADASASLLETLSALNRDERVMHFAAMATDDDGVRDALDAVATLDADDVVATAESLAADASARDDVVRKVNDAALGFLLRHLPAMPVPPVDVESDNVDYFLDNLNLSQLRIDENDVTVDVASSDGSRVVRKGVGLRAGGDDADGGGGAGGDGGALFALKAVRISATFPNLTWRFRQKQFPFLEAEGRADVAVADASVALALSARRRNSESGDPEPVVALTRCDVAIDDLELTMDEHRFSWVFNSLAGLFRDQIRDYVCEALRDLVVDKSRDLLEPINALLGASWAPLRRALDLPDVCDLPRLEGGCAAGDVDVTLRAAGPLGLELAQHPDDPRHLAVAGLVAGGQCAAALAQQGFTADDVAGARLVSVDGADARDLARDDTVVRVTSPARPRVLGLELAPKARAARARRRGGGTGGRAADVVLFDASPPGRRAETIGLKLKTHGTMTEACVVKDFARGPNGEVAAGERRGATVGFLLCACTGAPRLLRMSAGYATPALVGRRVLAEAKAAAATGAAFAVTLAPPPDVVVALAAGDAVNVAVGDVDGRAYFVLGDQPQNLADRGFAPGLALVAVGDAAVSPRTDAVDDVARLLADPTAKTATLRDVPKYEHLLARFATDD